MYLFKEWLKKNNEQWYAVKCSIIELMQMAYNAGQGDADINESSRITELEKEKEDLIGALQSVLNTDDNECIDYAEKLLKKFTALNHGKDKDELANPDFEGEGSDTPVVLEQQDKTE